MRTNILTAAALALALAFPLGAVAADETTLDGLLESVKNARAEEAKQNEARIAEFKAARDRQASLLAEAVRDRDAADARSQALSKQFDANELRIAELANMLKQREGNLGEVFGVTRQVAGDVSSALYQSMISAQYPNRHEFLQKLAGAKALPSIVELEQLWFEMQREMTESGRVARFKTKIVEPEGAAHDGEAVRIGPFTAMSDGRYLSYKHQLSQLTILPRQPPSDLTDMASDLQEATSGYVQSAVDPARGVLMDLYVQRPNWVERVQHGEKINYVILVVGGIGAVLAIWQFVYLLLVRMKVTNQLKNLDRPTTDNPLGRVLSAFKGDATRMEESAEVVELRISEAVLREVPLLERFQAFLRLAVAAGPLLGLIGTVVGMIITFQSITESGSSDPKLMAHGIGTAMIATVLGLGISIPLLFANAFLATMSRGLVQILDEQSTGLLAETLEKRGA
jgi:biopolymer transport protein ExbB